jgi:hypothetical protein
MNGKAIMEDPGNGAVVMRQFAIEGWRMLVIGEIIYRDDSGRDRLTGFLREWKSGGRFRTINDPDYEYED